MQGRINRRSALSSLVIFLTVVPANAQQVLFTDDFDAGTSGGRYELFHVDNDSDRSVIDTSANFAFDYGQFQYKHLNGLGEVVSSPIPSAPNSTGGTTTGVRFSVNDALPNGTAIISAYPKPEHFLNGAVPSGDYMLRFDLWLNHAAYAGSSGSTQFMVAGIKQEGGSIGGPVIGPGPFPPNDGYAMAIAGDLGTNSGYRIYRGHSRLADDAAGYLAQTEIVGTQVVFPDNGLNSFYQALFAEPEYETGGAPGKHWVTVEISHVDGVLAYRMNGTTITQRQETALQSGNILLGYADFLSNVAGPVEDNFVVFDNVVVTAFPATQPPRWIADADGVWSNASNWDGGVPNAAGAAAHFLDDVTAPRTIMNDARHTVGSIVFDSEQSYRVVGGSGLSLEGTSGPATITVVRGNHHISTPTPVRSDLVVDVQRSGDTLTTETLGSGLRIAKNGPGTLAPSRLTASMLELNEGTIALKPGEGVFGYVGVDELQLAGKPDAWTVTLDLADADLAIFADAATRDDVLRRTMNQVKGGRDGGDDGRWSGTGIISSAAAEDLLTGLAVVLNDRGDASPFFDSFAGRFTDANAVLVRYTWNGDANLDGIINADDYFQIDSGFLAHSPSPTYRDGDFNYDGLINADDYFLIDSAFLGQSGALGGPVGAAAIVPEPTIPLVLLVACCWSRTRRKRRR